MHGVAAFHATQHSRARALSFSDKRGASRGRVPLYDSIIFASCWDHPGSLAVSLVRKLGIPVVVQATWFRALARMGFHVHPRDEILLARFRSKRSVFEEIRTMLGEDLHLTYVGHKKTRVAGENEAGGGEVR